MIYKDSAAEVTAQLKKVWLTQFHRWIMHHCHETTQDKMNDLLCAESDWETLQVLYNSMDRLGQSKDREEVIKKFTNSLGFLYPGYMTDLKKVKDFRELKERLSDSVYGPAFNMISDPAEANDGPEINSTNTIDDVQKRDLSQRYSLAYFGQFHFATFYAYLKLKEQEITNLFQLATIISLGIGKGQNVAAWNKFVPPFQIDVEEDGQQ